MKLAIKNMVCGRCKRIVREALEGLGLRVAQVELGEVTISELPGSVALDDVRRVLRANDFELLDDRRTALIEQMKTLIINEIHHSAGEKPEHQNFSDFLAGRTGYEYAYLSHLFSSVEGLTIEKYVIAQKIERVKELLRYGELSLSEMAWQLGYSSVQHLSNQFKTVTGQTPGTYRKTHEPQRKPLDQV